MNLVIDDAVEVKQATKTEEEKRRELGAMVSIKTCVYIIDIFNRADTLKGG